MAALKEFFPAVKSYTFTYSDHSTDPWFKQRYGSLSENVGIKINPVPLYNTSERLKYRLSKPKDFGDGGALPEIHYAQYPLDMGRKNDTNYVPKTLPVTVDNNNGSLIYDVIVRQNENALQSQYKDLVPKILKGGQVEEEEEEVEKQKVIDETTLQTKAALEKIVNVRLSAVQRKNVQIESQDSKFYKYKPSQQSVCFNSGAKERVIRVVEMYKDPLEPSKFKHKKVPKANGSPPVPVMHSPPRCLTVKDHKDWKVPPCISNWKNPKGYTIPLDKRLAADGRGVQEVQINENFCKLSDALYVVERQTKEGQAVRAKVQKEMMMMEIERKERELRALAHKARFQRVGTGVENSRMDIDEPMKDDERLQRDEIRKDRRRERERESRLDAAMAKKSRITRDKGRDVSEKVALGMAAVGAASVGEVMYDQRLFNQEKGTGSGFATDDQYNVYDKGLFTAQPTLSTLYKPNKDADDEMYGGVDEQKIRKTDRFKPAKGFTGADEKGGPRDRPVEFEKGVAADVDVFGLDKILTEVTGGGNKPLVKDGRGGTMRASGRSFRI